MEYIVKELEHKLSITIKGGNLRTRHSNVPRYEIVKALGHDPYFPVSIIDISFSGISPDVIYILVDVDGYMYSRVIFSFCFTTLTLTKVTIDGIDLKLVPTSLLCHEEFVYIGMEVGNTSTSTSIYKCIVNEEKSSLKVIMINWISGWGELLSSDKDGHLYCCFKGDVVIIDGDTLTEIARFHYFQNAIPSVNGTLVNITTNEGYTRYEVIVRECNVDDRRRRLSEYCITKKACKEDSRFLARTINGNIIAGTSFKLALLSSNLKPLLSISPTSDDFQIIKCSPLDDTLAIVDDDNGLALLPSKVYLPPFSLTSLCVSAVLQHAEVLLVTCLPPGLQRLFKDYM